MKDKIEDYEVNSERWLSLEDFDGEKWKDIEGLEGVYQASNCGRIKSLDRTTVCDSKFGEQKRFLHGRIIKQSLNFNGYYELGLYLNGSRKTYTVHRLIAITFVPKENGKDNVDHIDGNQKNNISSNLRWCTHYENCNFEIAIERKRKVQINNTNAARNRYICDYITNFIYYLYNNWNKEEAIMLFGERLGAILYGKWEKRYMNDSLRWYSELNLNCKRIIVDRSNKIYNKKFNKQ